MAKLSYSDYPFFHKSSTNNNEPNDKEPKPIIEGIANFCALNRSYANQYPQGWSNLGQNINKANAHNAASSYANNMNQRLMSQYDGVDKYGMYKYTCENVNGTIRNRNNQLVSGGYVYAYSTDFNTKRGGSEVSSSGQFSSLNVKLVSSDENYVFAYEEPSGRTWALKVINGSSVVKCQTAAYSLQFTEPKRFGGDDDTRDPNGKLKNTDLRNSGAELRYNGMKAIYSDTLTNTVNLGLGIILASFFIVRSQ